MWFWIQCWLFFENLMQHEYFGGFESILWALRKFWGPESIYSNVNRIYRNFQDFINIFISLSPLHTRYFTQIHFTFHDTHPMEYEPNNKLKIYDRNKKRKEKKRKWKNAYLTQFIIKYSSCFMSIKIKMWEIIKVKNKWKKILFFVSYAMEFPVK